MPVIATVKAPEQWIMEVNGGYDVCFAEVTLAADAVDGEIVDGGIVSAGGSTGEIVRVMVRGNPSIVKASELTGDVSTLPASIVVA